jgi:hypothetical protein
MIGSGTIMVSVVRQESADSPDRVGEAGLNAVQLLNPP